MTEKYTVLPSGSEEPLEPGTYFVIRDTDALGHMVLWSYVGALQTVMEMAMHRPDMLTVEEVDALIDIESHVQALAERWQRSGKGRLPT
jgi:hypothetical protein